MKLTDIYDEVKSPITESLIKDIIMGTYTSYSTLNTDVSFMPDEINEIARDKYFVDSFNKWKNWIVELSKEEVIKRLKNPASIDKAMELIDILKSVPDINEYSELVNIQEKFFFEKEYYSVFSNLYWDSGFMYGSSWTQVKSCDFSNGNDITSIKHKIYLNVSNEIIYDFVSALVSEFDSKGINYNFKFTEEKGRNDKIILFADDSNLVDYINCINNVIQSHPEFSKKIANPPVTTGKLFDVIGYSAESGNNASYSEILSEIIRFLDTKNIVLLNKDKLFKYNDREINLSEILTFRIAKMLLLSLDEGLKNETGKFKYTVEELRSNEFCSKLCDLIREYVNQSLELLLAGKGLEELSIPLNFRKDYTLKAKLTGEHLLEAMITVPEIVEGIEEYIKDSLSKYGYDKEKGCFIQTVDVSKTQGESISVSDSDSEEFEPVIVNEIIIPTKVETDLTTSKEEVVIDTEEKSIVESETTKGEEQSIKVEHNPIIKPQELTIYYPEDGSRRFFVKSDDAKLYSVDPLVNPYSNFIPITEQKISKLEAQPNITLNYVLAQFPKPVLQIYFEARESGKCYLTNDYVIKSIGLKGVIAPDEIICGREIILNENQIEILNTYYDVKLLPIFGTVEPPKEIEESEYHLKGSNIIQDEPIKRSR